MSLNFLSMVRKGLREEAPLVFLAAWLSKKMEHVLLVDLDAGLVERVDPVKISRHRASALEEIEEIAKVISVHLLEFEDDVVVFANLGVGRDRAFESPVLDVAEGTALELV